MVTIMAEELTLKLSHYLIEIFNLESSIFTTRKLNQEIAKRIPSLGISKQSTITRPAIPDKLNEDIPSAVSSFGLAFLWPFINFAVTAGVVLFMVLAGGWLVDKITAGSMGTGGTILFVLLLTYVGGVIVAAIFGKSGGKQTAIANKRMNQTNQTEYQNKMKKYTQLIQSDKDRVAKEIATKKYFQSEVERLANLQNETQKALDALYNVGVIYPKYRHLIAVAMFCEYIQSGRCSELEGANGAYNLYETELRQNIIIDSLQKIISLLEDIKKTQYLIYGAMVESNRISTDTNYQLGIIQNEIIAGQQNVKASAELAAFYARETARNSRILVDLNRDDFYILRTKYGRMING